ncbi:MAG: transporter suffix domain-containing protein [Gammaproteobacteria bacterium]
MTSEGLNEVTNSGGERPQTGWRLQLGLAILIVGFASPLLIPVVTATDLPSGWKTAISGALALGIPEIFSIVAIAIMGRAGFDAIKARFFNFIKKHGPPDRVSKKRYRLGLVMFVLPLLFGWLGLYFAHYIPAYDDYRLTFNITGDLLLLSSFLVLGGEFWDKIRALFIHDAVAQMRRA